MANKKIKVYDWSGTLTDISGFLKWFEKNHPTLHRDYFVLGKTDLELKRKVRPEAIEIYEDATDRGLYEVSLIPYAKERLGIDREEGYVRTIFTSSPRSAVNTQVQNLGMQGSIDEVITLADIVSMFNLEGALKEDPKTFMHMIQFLRQSGFTNLASYADDTEKRIQALVTANTSMLEPSQGFQNIYHFDQKAKQPAEQSGYRVVNNLLDVI